MSIINKSAMPQKTIDTSITYSKPRPRIITDFLVVWLDSNINETNADYQKSITQLQPIVNSIRIFTDLDECVDCLTEIIHEKVFLIVLDMFSYHVIPFIQELSQLQSIYVLDTHKSTNNPWIRGFGKVKGIFDQIESMCNTLKIDIHQSSNSLMPISIINSPSSSTPTNLNELDQSFMYTQLLKDILLKMKDDNKAKEKLVEYCRFQCEASNTTLTIIEEFEKGYPDPSPIWWYTRECFVYWMLNRAFRTQDVEVIIKMGFFARDLHRQIEQIYSESSDRRCFTVYRGQGISNGEFMKMSQNRGGLLSFNNFLSTTTDREVAKMFAESAQENSDLTGVLFQMDIDPSISSTPFASPDKIGHFGSSEDEVLFSMHTIFRIGEMKQIQDRRWEVNLTLTSDNDEQLIRVTEYIRDKTDASTEPSRLGSLMFVMGEFDKAEEIFKVLLETTSNEDWTGLASLYHMLGYVSYEKDDQSSALHHFKQSLVIQLIYLPANDPKHCRNYSGIGLALKEQGDLDGALRYFQRSLELDLHTSQPSQLNIAIHHNNIGGVLDAQGNYADALKCYERTLEIKLIHLPSGHPSLSATYINIAGTYDSLEDSSTALSYYEKALEIQLKSLPTNHPWLATTYNNMAAAYDSLEDSLTALSFYEKALETQKKSSLPNDPSLATVHFNIARTLEDLDRYAEAVEHAVQAVDIVRQANEPNHPEVKENEEHLEELRQKL